MSINEAQKPWTVAESDVYVGNMFDLLERYAFLEEGEKTPLVRDIARNADLLLKAVRIEDYYANIGKEEIEDE